ncbi:MAG TPA: hypothetical protein VFA85_08555 [Terriglobales bacterium]|nr:hypothetical protein [Terriglobales bacterium]
MLAKCSGQLPARVTWESATKDEHIENPILDLFACMLERVRGYNIEAVMSQKQTTGAVQAGVNAGR